MSKNLFEEDNRIGKLYDSIIPVVNNLEKLYNVSPKIDALSKDKRLATTQEKMVKVLIYLFTAKMVVILIDYMLHSTELSEALENAELIYNQYISLVPRKCSFEYHTILREHRDIVISTLKSVPNIAECSRGKYLFN